MYKIIGADQKEYGPVTIDQIRQWIRDGRVNAHTQARSESGGQWQPLSAFPEFADAFAAGAPTMAPTPTPAAFPAGGGDTRDAAKRAVMGPAIALIVTAGLGIALYLLYALLFFAGSAVVAKQAPPPNLPPEGQAVYRYFQSLGGVLYLFFAAMNVVVLFGAIKMLRLESRTFALVACIIAMLPFTTFCCCILELPFAIWGLVVLSKPEVKSNFT
jgi:hypothetical protein